jgi:hypothetical protein
MPDPNAPREQPVRLTSRTAHRAEHREYGERVIGDGQRCVAIGTGEPHKESRGVVAVVALEPSAITHGRPGAHYSAGSSPCRCIARWGWA